MREHRLEVADVFRTYEKEFFAQWGHVLGGHQRKAFAAIRDCRTAALGGHVEYVEQCDTCGHRVISYNSCRDRHCPKCQALARAEWLAEREGELLPVPYFHLVFGGRTFIFIRISTASFPAAVSARMAFAGLDASNNRSFSL